VVAVGNTDTLPLGLELPIQPPIEVQDVALVDNQVSTDV
jgi:hypothetical protein